MTSTTLRSSIESQVQLPSQNTAPVLEYRCLFTHDLKRKAKRWQDGILRFHTFNRRVMVYDQARNFVGDTYCSGGGDVQEGDDLELEKHYALVQVSEPIGKTHTDLTELMQSRAKKPRLPSPIRKFADRKLSTAPVQKHRSLSTLLESSHAQLGKAFLPTLSPFEERQKRALLAQDHPAKRQRQASPTPSSPLPARHVEKHGTASSAMLQRPGHRLDPGPARGPRLVPQKATPGAATVIDLSSDDHAADESESRSRKIPAAPGKAHNVATANKNGVPPATPDRVTARSVPDPTPDGAHHNNRESRQPLKVIGNAPRKMLLCQKSRSADLNAQQKPATTTRYNSTTNAGHQAKETSLFQPGLGIDLPGAKRKQATTAAKEPLPPHEQRVVDRLARITRSEITKGDAGRTPGQLEGRQKALETRKPAQHPTASVPALTPRISEARGRMAPPTLSRARPSDKTIAPCAAGSAKEVAVVHAAGGVLAQGKDQSVTTVASDPLDSGPWSREACDLFDWWPPDRDKQGNKFSAQAVPV